MRLVAFPGQGSQTIGMAKDAFNKFALVRKIFREANDVLEWNLAELVFDGSDEQLKKTNKAQPALFVTCIALLRLLEHVSGMPMESFASFALGHSLGQCTALCAAGAIDFVSCLSLVKARGELMNKVTTGSMIACLNVPQDLLLDKVSQGASHGVCTLANYNSSSQLVVSGEDEALDFVIQQLQNSGYKAVKLNVAAGFHTSLMKEAAEGLKTLLAQTKFSKAKIPVIDNVTAKPIANVPEALAEHIISPVRWHQSIDYCLSAAEKSADTGLSDMQFIEIGPKNVLTSLAKRDGKPFKFFNLSDASSIYSFARSLNGNLV